MSVPLLDVNVLIALLSPAHVNHEDAHQWFGANRKRGWATCPIVLNGCVRILSSPAFQSDATPAEIAARLRTFTATPHHHFWTDSVSLLDETLFRHSLFRGHQKITDIYLLGLAVRNHGRLATFDRNITVAAVHGATPQHVLYLGPG